MVFRFFRNQKDLLFGKKSVLNPFPRYEIIKHCVFSLFLFFRIDYYQYFNTIRYNIWSTPNPVKLPISRTSSVSDWWTTASFSGLILTRFYWAQICLLSHICDFLTSMSRINKPIPGMFVLIWMHFSLWLQIWSWQSGTLAFLTNLLSFGRVVCSCPPHYKC